MIIDGWQLRFPQTGLGNVTAHVIREFVKQGRGSDTHVFVPGDADLSHWNLPTTSVGWHVLSGPFARTDYIARWQWSRAFSRAVRTRHAVGKVFVPYLYNHFPLRRRSLVFVPDLVYRELPFYDDSATRWWNFRKRFYLRRGVVRFEEWLVTKAAGWITTSRFVADEAAHHLRVPRSSIVVSTHGPGPSYPARKAESERTRPPDFLGDYVLYVGGFGYRKNISMLLEASELLSRSEPGFRLMLAGISETQLKANPQYQAGWNGVKTGAIVCLGKPNDPELVEKYSNSRFTVFPSKGEGFGLPLVEAAACGACTLVADNSSLAELQREPRLRIPTTDVQAWANAMKWLWNDHVVRRELEGRLGRNFKDCTVARFADDAWKAADSIR